MKDPKHWFTISTIIYFVAYALPALGDGSSDSMFGIQCAFFAFYYMFFVPVVFLGNLSNLMTFTIFILKFRKSTAPQGKRI
ncbi:MAG: hypothetical protein GY810_22735 [Aureispira sp.]|nr:hypothetical protein [Aureispira sp.]